MTKVWLKHLGKKTWDNVDLKYGKKQLEKLQSETINKKCSIMFNKTCLLYMLPNYSMSNRVLWHVNLSWVILCLELREFGNRIHIYIFCIVASKELFFVNVVLSNTDIFSNRSI